MRSRDFKGYILVLALVFIFISAVPGFAAVRDAYLGDVLLIAWMEEDLVKVALANDSLSRSTITLASAAWDDGWRSSLVDRTVVVPARTVVIEAFPITSSWERRIIQIEASAWDRRVTLEVQTGEIFNPRSYLVQAQSPVEVSVELDFLFGEGGSLGLGLTVDDYYRGWGLREPGRIWIKSIDGGFQKGHLRNSVEFTSPQMILTMDAPRPQGDLAVFTFSMYEQRPRGFRDFYQREIPGPSIIVYSRNLKLRDNTHLARPQVPAWESNY